MTGCTKSVPKRPSARGGVRPCTAVIAAGAALAAALVPLPPGLVETWYSRGAYPIVQRALTPLTNLVPVAVLDAAILVAVAIVLSPLLRRHANEAHRWRRALTDTALTIVVGASVAYLAFLALWGLNYRRVPLEEQLVFDPRRVSAARATDLLALSAQRLNRSFVEATPEAIVAVRLDDGFALAQEMVGSRGRAVPGLPKASLLGYYFRAAAIDGMTVPFFLEIILNPETLPIERPFVVAHEWAHLAGYANEAEASFVAWLSCLRAGPLAQYSGWLAVYGHASSAVPRDDRARIAAGLQPGPRRDLDAIVARYRRSSPVVRGAARDAYDAYLRANRVSDGVASYDAVTRLMLGTAANLGDPPTIK